jgi:HNH endonuclease/AP2 domain
MRRSRSAGDVNPRITHERAMECFDYRNGNLFWRIKPNRRIVIGSLAGTHRAQDGYRHIIVDGEQVMAHRLIWFIHHGRWPSEFLDHINGNPSDNRLENLRECTNGENIAAAMGLRRDNTSGLRGVHLDQRRQLWVSQITVGGKIIWLGSYAFSVEAGLAYDRAARSHFGEFARTNFECA